MTLGLQPADFLLLAHGIATTVRLTLAAAVLGLATAFAFGIAQLARSVWLRRLATVYIEFWRGASALVQLFVVFYALPAIGITLPPFLVGVLVLGLNVGAYGSQIVRAGIQGVDAGQREAARALGLRGFVILRLVVVPQALPAMLPAFGNEAVELLKLTAATSLITLQDLSLTAKMLVQRDNQPTRVYAIELLLYFLLALPLLWLARWLERRARSRGLHVAGTPIGGNG